MFLLNLPLCAGRRAGAVPGTSSHPISVLRVSLSASGTLDPQNLKGGHLRVEREMDPFAGTKTFSARGSLPPSKAVWGIKVGHTAVISITC